MKKIIPYISIFMFANALCASSIYVSPSGKDSNDGSSWQSSLKTLAKAVEISKPDDEIFLKSGTYTLSEQLNISKKLKITGGFNGDETSSSPSNAKPSVIQGNNKFRLLYVNGAQLNVSCLTFTKGKATRSFFVSIRPIPDPIPIRPFEENSIEKEYIRVPMATEDTPDLKAWGGAILANNAPLFIKNCIFKNNSAESGGSYSEGDGVFGGAIAAIATESSALGIKNSEFVSNSAKATSTLPAKGGAVYAENSTQLLVSIENTKFTSNKAISARPSSSGGRYIIALERDFEFNPIEIHNRLAQGGAVFSYGGLISNCDFEKNEASSILKDDTEAKGGALAIIAKNSSEIFQNLFLSNSAKGDDAFGGALYIECEDADVLAEQNNFIKNSADEGGAIAIIGSPNASPELNANYFESNQADEGAGIALAQKAGAETKPVSITNSTFYKNKADEGGAIAYSDDLVSPESANSSAKVLFNTFRENSAKEGSAISLEGSLYASSNIFADSAKQAEIYIDRDDTTSVAVLKNSIVPALSAIPARISMENVKEANPMFAGLRTEGVMTSFSVAQNSPATTFAPDAQINVSADIFLNARSGTNPTIGAVEYKGDFVEVSSENTSVSLIDGEKLALSVSATKYTGKLSYQWFVDKNDGKGFVPASSKKDTISIKASAKVPQSTYKCLVSDATGASAYSGEHKISVFPKPKITENINYKGSFRGENTVLSVGASGENLYYQWQVFKDGAWRDIEGENSQNIVLENLQSENMGERYRAQVGVKVDGKIIANSFVSSKEAKISLSEPAGIGGVRAVQKQAEFDQSYSADASNIKIEDLGAGFATELSVQNATGAKPKYQWQILTDAENGIWQDIEKAVKPTYSFTENKEGSASYRCKVYCELGSLISEKFTPQIDIDFVMPPIPASIADNALKFDIDGEKFTLVCPDAKNAILINNSLQESGSWLEGTKVAYKFKNAKEASLSITANQCAYGENGKKQTIKISYNLALKYDGVSRAVGGTYTEGKTTSQIKSASLEFEVSERAAVLPDSLQETNMVFKANGVSYGIIFENAKLYSIVNEEGKVLEQGSYSGKKSGNTFAMKLKPSLKNEDFSVSEFNLYAAANKFWTNIKYSDFEGVKFCADEPDGDVSNEYLAPEISENLPETFTVESGKSATLEVVAYGTDLKYQWFCNSEPIAKANTNKLTQKFDKAKDNGKTYFVEVSNESGSVSSRISTVRVIEPLALKSITADKKACIRDDSITLTANATGENIFYEWFYSTDGKEWKVFSSGTLNTCIVSPNDIEKLKTAEKVFFKAEIYDALDAEKTNVKSFAMKSSIAIVSPSEIQMLTIFQPEFELDEKAEGTSEESSLKSDAQFEVLQGSKLTLSAVATGYQIKYQWQKLVFENENDEGAWKNISGATSRSYTLTPDVNGDWNDVENFYNTYRCKVYSTATRTQVYTKAVELKCNIAAIPENPVGTSIRVIFDATQIDPSYGSFIISPDYPIRRYDFTLTPVSTTEAMLSKGGTYWIGNFLAEYVTNVSYTYKRTSSTTAELSISGDLYQITNPNLWGEFYYKSIPIEITLKLSTTSSIVNSDNTSAISARGTMSAYYNYEYEAKEITALIDSKIIRYDKNSFEKTPKSLDNKSMKFSELETFNEYGDDPIVSFGEKTMSMQIGNMPYSGTYSYKVSSGKMILTGEIDYLNNTKITVENLTIYPNYVPEKGYPFSVKYTYGNRKAEQSGFVKELPKD